MDRNIMHAFRNSRQVAYYACSQFGPRIKRPLPRSQVFQPRHMSSSSDGSSCIPARDYLEQSNKTDQYSPLPCRGFLEIEGPDAAKFLQGLITNQVSKIERGGDGIYAAFLTPQGRILYDAFIYPKNRGDNFPDPCFVIEHDMRVTSALRSHLQRYKLRAKLQITDVNTKYRAYQIWGPTTSLLWGSYVPVVGGPAGKALPAGSVLPRERFCDIGCKDPRHIDMGLRIILEHNAKLPLPASFSESSVEEYNLRRILYGIPEGADDFFEGSSLPLESNLDLISGVDFRKGCYLGQELTIRTYHTGVTRKRIVPVQFYSEAESPPNNLTVDKSFTRPLPGPQSDVVAQEQQQHQGTRPRGRRAAGGVGKVCSGLHNVGLALMRLDYVQSKVGGSATGNGDMGPLITDNGWRVRAFIPHWWPHPLETHQRP